MSSQIYTFKQVTVRTKVNDPSRPLAVFGGSVSGMQTVSLMDRAAPCLVLLQYSNQLFPASRGNITRAGLVSPSLHVFT